MSKLSQKQWVIEQLKHNKRITRNQCLQNFISRLGALIEVLENEGWVFKAHYEETERGKDYVYDVISEPLATLRPEVRVRRMQDRLFK